MPLAKVNKTASGADVDTPQPTGVPARLNYTEKIALQPEDSDSSLDRRFLGLRAQPTATLRD